MVEKENVVQAEIVYQVQFLMNENSKITIKTEEESFAPLMIAKVQEDKELKTEKSLYNLITETLIDFVTKEEASQYYKRTGNVVLDEHTIENRDYAIKLGLPKEKIRMQYQQCGTPVTEPLVMDDIFKIPYGLWDSYRKRYLWKMTLITKDKTKYIHSYYYQGLNLEEEILFGERTWGENQIEKYKIPEKFQYTSLIPRAIPFIIFIKWYGDDGKLYRLWNNFNEAEVMDSFEKAFKGQENEVGNLIIEVNNTKTGANIRLKVGEREVEICNVDLRINEIEEWQ